MTDAYWDDEALKPIITATLYAFMKKQDWQKIWIELELSEEQRVVSAALEPRIERLIGEIYEVAT